MKQRKCVACNDYKFEYLFRKLSNGKKSDVCITCASGKDRFQKPVFKFHPQLTLWLALNARTPQKGVKRALNGHAWVRHMVDDEHETITHTGQRVNVTKQPVYGHPTGVRYA